MWRITKVSCENFISFQSATVEIPQNICTLVYGVNLDNEKQKNNGTGKSSIIEAIAFGLTGEPLRGVDKAEEIINDHSDSAHVELELENDFDNTTLVISRTLFRKAPQQIECHKYNSDGVEVDMDKTVCPTVLDYNRYILGEIGLTKDDIYANFILSDTHYKSFFDANDKTKKAMINRFSGADAVDKAIEKLQIDKEPVQGAFDDAKDAKIAADAKVDAINQQIVEMEDNKDSFEADKVERIKSLQDKIADKREEERQNKETINRANERLDKIDEVGAKIEDMQGNDLSLLEVYGQVNGYLEQYKLSATKDYPAIAKESESAIDKRTLEQKELQENLDSLMNRLDKANKALDKAKSDYALMERDNKLQDEKSKKVLADIKQDMDKIKSGINELRQKTSSLKDTSDELDSMIRNAKNKLHGAIVCPKCGHEFFLNDNERVEDVKKKMQECQAKLEANEREIEQSQIEEEKLDKENEKLIEDRTFENKQVNSRADKLSQLSFDVNDAASLVSEINKEISGVKYQIERLQSEIEGERGRIEGLMNNMLQEALDIIDNAIDKGERYVKNIKEQNVAISSSIEAFEKSIETIKNSSQDALRSKLEQSLAQLKTDQQKANIELEKAKKELDKYILQENYFVEFRSYLANKKVEAIAGVTNYFLELIGSDLRVEMLGYKKLKSGKIRDKITVNLLRDGKVCGEFSRFSGGEKSRINIASILGLQKLTNSTVENGKGLEFMAADEVLDKADTTGIEAINKALNKLQVTSLIVTQNPISDSEGHSLVVVKQNDYSTIQQDK